jgi:hypothetical protein
MPDRASDTVARGGEADLLALITAIVGAIAGANLALILLDMLRARSVEDRRTSDGERVRTEA